MHAKPFPFHDVHKIPYVLSLSVTDTTGFDSADHQQSDSGIWLGATDKAQERHFVWVPSGRPLMFTDWDTDEPNDSDGDEDCLMYSFQARKWNDFPCDHTSVFRWICEG